MNDTIDELLVDRIYDSERKNEVREPDSDKLTKVDFYSFFCNNITCLSNDIVYVFAEEDIKSKMQTLLTQVSTKINKMLVLIDNQPTIDLF